MLSISYKWLKGDLNAFKVLDCLSRIASLYGEQFIMLQYIKHIADLVCNILFIMRMHNGALILNKIEILFLLYVSKLH